MALDLTVMEPGYSLGRSGEVLELRNGGEVLERFPLHRIRSLVLGPGIGLSSDILVALADRGAAVLVQDRQERTGAVLYAPRAFGAAALRRAQCQVVVGPEGLKVARLLVGAKLLHQARLLKSFGQATGAPKVKEELAGLGASLHALAGQVHARADRPELMALEAQGARLHWQGVGLMRKIEPLGLEAGGMDVEVLSRRSVAVGLSPLEPLVGQLLENAPGRAVFGAQGGVEAQGVPDGCRPSSIHAMEGEADPGEVCG